MKNITHLNRDVLTPRTTRYRTETKDSRNPSSRFPKVSIKSRCLLAAALILYCWIALPTRALAIAGCDGPYPDVYVSVTASNTPLSVLSTNQALFAFRLLNISPESIVLGVAYTGTAQNGVDVETLPTTVTFPAGTKMVDVPVTPKVTDPFSEKTLTATITSISSANPCVHLGMPNSATVKLTGFDAPRLEIASLNSTNVLLFWESPVSGYVTQCSSNLQSGTWVTLTNQPAEVEGTNQVIVNAVNGPAFFRLMKP